MGNTFTDATVATAGTDFGRTLSTMRTEVRGNVGDERTDLNATIDQYLNTAQLELARMRRWADLEVWDTTNFDTVADAATVTPPSAMMELLDMILEDGQSSFQLAELTPFEFRRRYPNPETSETSTPTEFAYIDEVIRLGPVPDAAYDLHLHYKKRPDVMDSDSDEPEIDHCEDYLVARATERCMMRLGMFQDAQAWGAGASALMASLLEEDRQTTVPRFDGRGRGFGAPTATGLDYTSPFYRPATV